MFTNFKIMLRHLWRQRLFTSLNILGLAIGISACWIIYRIVSHELSYDKNLPGKENIYKVVSFSGNQIFFVRNEIATSIINKAEFSTLNKMERALDGIMIKESCIKLKVDRLGNITV